MTLMTRRAMMAAGAATVAGCGSDPAGEPSDPAATPDDDRVHAAPDGESVQLASGLVVALACVRAPAPRSGRALAEPGFTAARDALTALAIGERLAFAPDLAEATRDRWGRVTALAWRRSDPEASSLQRRLVRAGLVRVDPERVGPDDAGAPDWDAASTGLLEAESEARAAARGVWREAYFAVRPADAASASIGAYQLVEGVVTDVAQVRGRVYINFGPDYRTDFTASIAPDHVDRFVLDDVFALPGARVRARGFVEARNGPMIALSRPPQLEGPWPA